MADGDKFGGIRVQQLHASAWQFQTRPAYAGKILAFVGSRYYRDSVLLGWPGSKTTNGQRFFSRHFPIVFGAMDTD